MTATEYGPNVLAVLRFAAKKHEVKVSSILNGKVPDVDAHGHTREWAKSLLDLMVTDGLLTSSKPAQVYIYKPTDNGLAAVQEVA